MAYYVYYAVYKLKGVALVFRMSLESCLIVDLHARHLRGACGILLHLWIPLAGLQKEIEVLHNYSAIPQRQWPAEAYFFTFWGTNKVTIWGLMVQKHHFC